MMIELDNNCKAVEGNERLLGAILIFERYAKNSFNNWCHWSGRRTVFE